MRGRYALSMALIACAALGQPVFAVEVPGPQAIQSGVKGASARDRLARQSATAFVLGNLVRVQAGKAPNAEQSARIAELENFRTSVENENETLLPVASAAATARSATRSIAASPPISSRRNSTAQSLTASSTPRRRNRCRPSSQRTRAPCGSARSRWRRAAIRWTRCRLPPANVRAAARAPV
jgi:hypothetical protein